MSISNLQFFILIKPNRKCDVILSEKISLKNFYKFITVGVELCKDMCKLLLSIKPKTVENIIDKEFINDEC